MDRITGPGLLAQLVRFGLVGGLATLVHVLAALSAQSLFHLSAQAANLVGFCVAVLVSYLGHLRFTFDVSDRSGAQFLRFVAMSGLSLMTSSATVWLIATRMGLGFGVAMAAVTIVVPAASFMVMRFWVFARA
jgi:putative flippase GtrA